ncbi:hypothetical protein ACIQUP_27155 [Streptomyces nigra]|uniref:hypothetical protein n=1 Tax=Streptomyces nigra TaxID=1827580 RepID=UPI0038300637
MERGLERLKERGVTDRGNCLAVLQQCLELVGRSSVPGQSTLGVPAHFVRGISGRQGDDDPRVTGLGLLGGNLRAQLPGRRLLLEGDQGSARPVVRPMDPLLDRRLAEQRVEPGLRDVLTQGRTEEGPHGQGNVTVLGQRQCAKGG